MADLYLIEYAYRSLYFLDYLNNSLKNWESVVNINKNLFLKEKQIKFNEINNDNLLKYLLNEKENENCPKKLNNYKINIIRNWAISNKINLSKNLSFDELYELSDKIFLIYKNELNQMRSEKNEILSLCFPQLINNLFSLFDILNEIKKIFLKEKNSEMDKYSQLILECEEKSQTLKSYEKNLKNKYNNEKKILNKQISNLFEENNKIKKNLEDSQNELKNLEKYKEKINYLTDENNDLFLTNERLQSDVLALKQEMNFLKNKIEDDKKERDEQIENMKTEMEKERTEKEKFMIKIKNYLEETENFFRKQKEDFNENFLKEK